MSILLHSCITAMERLWGNESVGYLDYVCYYVIGSYDYSWSDDAVSAEAYGDLKVYRGNIDEAAGKALAPGDRVMVVGKLKNNFYNNANSAQMNAGSEVTVMWKQAIEQIVLTEKVNKVIVDGVIYIVRDGKLYNLQGAQVR